MHVEGHGVLLPAPEAQVVDSIPGELVAPAAGTVLRNGVFSNDADEPAVGLGGVRRKVGD
jgi:hypothetical protein